MQVQNHKLHDSTFSKLPVGPDLQSVTLSKPNLSSETDLWSLTTRSFLLPGMLCSLVAAYQSHLSLAMPLLSIVKELFGP